MNNREFFKKLRKPGKTKSNNEFIRKTIGITLILALMTGIVAMQLTDFSANAADATATISGKVSVTDTTLLTNELFTFNLTQVNQDGSPMASPAVAAKTAKNDALGNFSFTIADLTNGTYYFKVTEKNDGVDGWEYDPVEYIVKVVVRDGKAVVYYPDGTVTGDSVVSTTTAESQKIEIPTGGMTTIGSGTISHGVDHSTGINVYHMHEKDYYIATYNIPHMYLATTGSSTEVVVGTAYCIDYFTTTNASNPYKPYFDYDGFVNRYTDTGNTEIAGNGGGKYEEFLWLVRNGFMSSVKYSLGVWNASNTNIDSVRGIIDAYVSGAYATPTSLGAPQLTYDEAYAVTQLAIWHFSNGIEWVYDPEYIVSPPHLDEENVLVDERVYAAYLALVAAAEDAVQNRKAITERSMSVHFDTSAAQLTGSWYGPVGINVDLIPADFTTLDEIPVTVTSPGGALTLSLTGSGAGASSLTLYGKGAGGGKPYEFYVNIGSDASIGTRQLAMATAEVSATATLTDVYVFNHQPSAGTVNWDATQTLIGVGSVPNSLEVVAPAAASLFYSETTTQGKLSFFNSFDQSIVTPTTKTITVKKEWAGTNPAGHPTATGIQVQLYKDSVADGAPVALNATNGWTYTWNGLDSESEWTVDEVSVPTSYAKSVTTSGATTTITNTYTTPGPYYPPSNPVTPTPSTTPSPSPSPSASPSPPPTDDADDLDDPDEPFDPFPPDDPDEPGEPGDFNPFEPNDPAEPPYTPGGTDPLIPPAPTVEGRELVQNGDTWLELDDLGVPLGEWHWDDDEEMWIFDPFPPLGDMPQTGTSSAAPLMLLLLGSLLICCGIGTRVAEVLYRKPQN